VVELEPVADERGFFARIWSADELAANGLDTHLSQCSLSRNTTAGTLRGLHFQQPPHAEVKLVRCTRGSLFDVVVDLRPESATYCQWIGVELDAREARALYIPKGCAHGFQTLEDETDVLYMISDPYVPSAASGVRWNDPVFAIDWPSADRRTISDRDRSWPDYSPSPERS
jgi:dTDP-4-dehydrorhamnose 3,5-epimerase